MERARDRLNSMALEAQRRGEPLCGEMILKQNSMVEMLSNAAQQAGLLPVAQPPKAYNDNAIVLKKLRTKIRCSPCILPNCVVFWNHKQSFARKQVPKTTVREWGRDNDKSVGTLVFYFYSGCIEWAHPGLFHCFARFGTEKESSDFLQGTGTWTEKCCKF